MKTVTVEKNFSSLNCTVLKEIEVNHLASEYLAENYQAIINKAKHMNGVDPDKADDLVNDVWISLIEGEEKGKGYDISHSNEGDIIGVDDFVYGRVKLYSKNAKYQIGGQKKIKTSRDKDGVIKAECEFQEISCSPVDLGDDNVSGIQRAYLTASAVHDGIESVEDEIDLRNNIRFCIKFNEMIGFDILNMFRNIDMFARFNFDNGLFDHLKNIMKKHEEFRDALESVLTCASEHRPIFDAILSEF